MDFGPEGATLTVNGTVSVADDVFTFPGSASDYIDAVQAATDTSTNVYSISGWFNADSIGAAFQTIAVHATGGGGPPMLVRLTTSSTLQFFHVSQSVSSIAVSSGNWYHFAAVWDGVNIELFLDGVSQGTAAYSTAETLGTAWEIGNWTLNNSHFAGKLADLRFNNYALTAGEVFDLYNNGRGYDLPERKQLPNTRLHLVDGLTDAGFYGTEVTNDGATYANGVHTFDGTDDYITHGELLTSQTFSVSFWFKTASSANMYLWQAMNESTAEAEGTGVQLTGVKVRFFHGDGTAIEWLDKSLTYDDDAWHHVVCTWDGTTQTVYVDDDGSPATRTDGSIVWPAVADLVAGFGRDHRTGRLDKYFNGQLADVRIIEGTLTAGEVANLYRKGLPALRDAEVLRIDPARYSGSGDLIDQTGNGNDLTLPSGYTVSDGVVNTVDTANGPNTGVSLDGIAGTVSMWVKSTDTDVIGLYQAATRFALCWEDGGSGSTATGVSNVTLYVDGAAITDNRNTFHDAVADGTWHHIAMTGDFDAGWSTVHLFRAVSGSLWRMNGSFDKLLIASGVKYTANQIAFLASSREFADPFPEPFLGLGGETLNIQPSRYSGNGDLLDESGNGNDLTLPSGYSVADGVISSDGTADGPDSGVSFTSQTASIGVWVKTTDTTFMIASSGAAEYLGAAVNNGPAHHSGTSNVTTYIDGETGSYHTQSQLLAALNDGQWHHFAFTADFNSSWGNAQFFDYNSSSSWRFTGETDDLRIETGRKWSAEEVKLLASSRGVELPNTRDAKLYFAPSYDDASNGGTSVIDYSGNQNTGAFTGSPAWTADTNESGTRALSFSGSGDYINAGSGVLDKTITQMSIVAWINATDTANQKDIVAKYGNTGQRGYVFDVQADGQLRLVTASAPSGSTTSALSGWGVEGVWKPVIVTYDAGTVNLYADGESASGSGSSSINDNGLDTLIGATSDSPSTNFEGLIDDVLVFDRVLTPAEIAFFSDKRNPYGTPYTAPTPSSGSAPIFIRCLTSRGIF